MTMSGSPDRLRCFSGVLLPESEQQSLLQVAQSAGQVVADAARQRLCFDQPPWSYGTFLMQHQDGDHGSGA